MGGFMLKAGDKLPDFNLENQDGKSKRLSDYAGKWLVLYVYPKDDTPGCTIQGKSFTEQKAAFDRLGVNIVGLSADDVQSHKDFCTKYSFTIDLLADPRAKYLTDLGIGQSEYKGTMYWNRSTYLVDPSGVIRKVYENVKPQGHEEELLRDIQEMRRT
jgi:thioredoxin-dependent peroxiredoxin